MFCSDDIFPSLSSRLYLRRPSAPLSIPISVAYLSTDAGCCPSYRERRVSACPSYTPYPLPFVAVFMFLSLVCISSHPRFHCCICGFVSKPSIDWELSVLQQSLSHDLPYFPFSPFAFSSAIYSTGGGERMRD